MATQSRSGGAAGDAVVLAVNVGSSSLKFGLYGPHGPARWAGQYSGLQSGGPFIGKAGETALPAAASALAAGGSPFDLALAHLVERIRADGMQLAAVAHRIVHGGPHHAQPCRLDSVALRQLAALNPLAPLHQPHNLAGVEAFAQAWPDVPQIGCFDTAFHAGLPAVERRLPLPRALDAQGLRRYGFHGLSYAYLAQALRERTPAAAGRCVLAHLGNGASVCATRSGQSVATSMGFSALDGLMMGTRSGSLDPGVLLHLWREGWELPAVERLLYRESGLLGVSGLSADMRALRAAAGNQAARDAIALFTHRVVREVGASTAVLGGIDLLAFTGGIGEHDALLRADVAAALGFAGVAIDPEANHAASGNAAAALHRPGSAVEVWVIPTDEGRMAAQGAFELLAAAAP